MRRLFILTAVLLAGTVQAHQVDHAVRTGPAVIVELRYGDGSPFSYESAELYRPGETIPFLVGHTDANGRLAFVPDRAGEWRVKVFSEDGHGGDFTVATSGEGSTPVSSKGLGTVGGLVVGLSLLFGLFGFWSLFLRKKP